jgi:hypothetical protein
MRWKINLSQINCKRIIKIKIGSREEHCREKEWAKKVQEVCILWCWDRPNCILVWRSISQEFKSQKYKRRWNRTIWVRNKNKGNKRRQFQFKCYVLSLWWLMVTQNEEKYVHLSMVFCFLFHWLWTYSQLGFLAWYYSISSELD